MGDFANVKILPKIRKWWTHLVLDKWIQEQKKTISLQLVCCLQKKQQTQEQKVIIKLLPKSIVTQFRTFNYWVTYNVPHENKQLNKQTNKQGFGMEKVGSIPLLPLKKIVSMFIDYIVY